MTLLLVSPTNQSGGFGPKLLDDHSVDGKGKPNNKITSALVGRQGVHIEPFHFPDKALFVLARWKLEANANMQNLQNVSSDENEPNLPNKEIHHIYVGTIFVHIFRVQGGEM